MQSAQSARYSSAFNCVSTVLREEGVLRFWKGTTPRLTRLILSGGIVFTIYEKTLVALDVLGGKAKETAKVVADTVKE
jgi:solute carrier family 25 citrate transporter 1